MESFFEDIFSLFLALIWCYLFVLIIKKVIKWFINHSDLQKDNNENTSSPSLSNVDSEIQLYKRKSFMTDCEYEFYLKLLNLGDEYRIIPQINLATIIEKVNGGFINELFKNIDFAIFDKDLKKVLLLIELNDRSHNDKKRIKRDIRVKKICMDADIKLITFYTNYPNETDYVINRVKKNIK